MAMLSDDDSPAILRGPMVTKYLQMFVRQVDWGALDVCCWTCRRALAISS